MRRLYRMPGLYSITFLILKVFRNFKKVQKAWFTQITINILLSVHLTYPDMKSLPQPVRIIGVVLYMSFLQLLLFLQIMKKRLHHTAASAFMTLQLLLLQYIPVIFFHLVMEVLLRIHVLLLIVVIVSTIKYVTLKTKHDSMISNYTNFILCHNDNLETYVNHINTILQTLNFTYIRHKQLFCDSLYHK